MTISGVEFVLLRGLAREARHWGDFPKQLVSTIPNAIVHTPDFPGMGTQFKGRSPWDVNEILRVLTRDLPPCRSGYHRIAVGLSLGGMVALAGCHRDAMLWDGAVILNSSAGDLVPFYHRLRPAALMSLLRSFFHPSIRYRERLVLRLVSSQTETQLQTALEKWVAIQMSHPVSRSNTLRQLLAAARFRAPEIDGSISLLILSSRGDRMVSPQSSQRLAEYLHAPLVIHQTAGHDLPLDDPQWVVRQIAQWISRVQTKRDIKNQGSGNEDRDVGRHQE